MGRVGFVCRLNLLPFIDIFLVGMGSVQQILANYGFSLKLSKVFSIFLEIIVLVRNGSSVNIVNLTDSYFLVSLRL